MFRKNLSNFLGITLGFCFLLSGIAMAKFDWPVNLLSSISKISNNYNSLSHLEQTHQTTSSSVFLKFKKNLKAREKEPIKPNINNKNNNNQNWSKKENNNDFSSGTVPKIIKTVSNQPNSNNDLEQNLQNISSDLDQLINWTNYIVNKKPNKNNNINKYIENTQKENKARREPVNALRLKIKPTSTIATTSLSLHHQNILTYPKNYQNINTKDKKVTLPQIGVLKDKIYKVRQNISEIKNQINETVEKKKIMDEAIELSMTKKNSNNSKTYKNHKLSPEIKKIINRQPNNQIKSKLGKIRNTTNLKSVQNINEIKKIINQTKVSRPPLIVNKLENSAKSVEKLTDEAKKIALTSNSLSNQQKEKIISLSTQIEQKAQVINVAAKEIKSKTTVNLTKDSDGDGISDFAEITIYHTNPNNSDTDGDGLSDGDEIKNGFDPLKPNNDNIFQNLKKESPKTIKSVKPYLLQVDHISNVIVKNPKTKQEKKKIVISGKSLPNVYLTVYVYSNSIVAIVKTDSEGRWQLTINNRLNDGSHEVYVALADSQGKLIARSNPNKFLVSAGLAVTEEDLRRTASIGGFPWFSLVYYGLASLIILVGGLLIIMTTKKI